MLRWSGQDQDVSVDLDTIASGCGSGGLPLGQELVRFASATASMRGPTDELDGARRALADAGGAATMLDAAAVAANFHMMTRLADGTGARYPASRQADMAAAIGATGADAMASRR